MRSALLILAAGLLGSAPLALVAPTALAADRHATAACQLASNSDRARAGDVASLQALAQQISYAAAASTEPAIRRSATRLGHTTRQLATLASLQSALRQFQALCRGTVGVTSARSHEVPEAEFDRQLRDVLERSGTPNAACEKQQFGGGWVAVCR